MKRIAILVLLGWGLVRPAAAQTPPLADVPLEQLLRLEVQNVFGASERLQPVTEAPSSVTIITAEEIDRFGYRTLADVLRGVRGFYVSDDRNYSYVGVRGFARAGDYNTRVLLLLNGHRINDDVYDQAPVGNELAIDPGALDRVEIIRGPASSLYGTNAFFAVVNLVTKAGRPLSQTRIETAAGSFHTAELRGYTGGDLAGVKLGFAGSLFRTSGVKRLYFPAFDSPATNGGIAEGLDGDRLASALGTLAFKDLTITGVYGRRDKDVPTASYGTLFNPRDPREWTRDERVIVGVGLAHAFGRTRLDVRSTFNRYVYYGEYPFASATTDPLLDRDGALGVRWSIDARVTRPLPGAQTLTAGGELLDNLRQNQSSVYNDPSVGDLLANHASTQVAAYAQDEIKLRRWLIANLGARVDRYEAFTRATPRLALILLPSANQSFKYVYGRAFRAPNAYELYYYEHQLPGLAPESIGTHEVDWERYFGSLLRTSVSAYAYRASQLITFTQVQTADDLSGYVFVNHETDTARGIEFEAELRSRRGIQAVASYAVQRAIDDDERQLTNSPRQLAKFRVGAPAPGRASAAFELQYVGRRNTLAGNTVGAATLANVSVRKQLNPGMELFGLVANAFAAHYFDPASDEHAFDAIEQNGRTVRVGLRWMPWGR
jgi:outer membrane receptor for ferrienterochelin and colicins